MNRRFSSLHIFALGVVSAGVGLLLFNGFRAEHLNPLRPMPPILTQIQSLGELHTARFNFQNVGKFETWKQPASWAEHIPFATSVVHWATDNSVLGEYSGSVEAGLDLSHASETTGLQGGKIVRILVLPPVHLYPAEIIMHVDEEHHTKYFEDANIAPDALKAMQTQYQEASLRRGIIQVAQRNAIVRLHKFLIGLGAGDVQIQFSTTPNGDGTT